MKKLIAVICLILTSIFLIAQNNCADAVHPTNYRQSILDCCIREIKPGNVVSYVKNGQIHEIEAKAINYKGKYFDLQNTTPEQNKLDLYNFPDSLETSYDYRHLEKAIKKGKSQIATGVVLCVAGAGVFVAGVAIMNKRMQEWEDSGYKNTGNGMGFMVTLLGGAGIGVGIPTAIVGGSKKRKAQEALINYRKTHKLTLQTTNTGIGLVYNF